jgi:type II secretion system protein N
LAFGEESRCHGRAALSMRNRLLLFAGYGAVAAILFVAFLAASFPYADTISALAAPMRMKVVFQRQEMNFPIGARLQNVRLLSMANERLLLQSPDVRLTPGLVWFCLGQPHLRIRAQIYGGVADATIYQSARAINVDFELQSLNLASMSPTAGQPEVDEEDDALPRLGIALSGVVSASGSAQLTGPDISAGRANMVVFGRGVEAAIINGLPPLDLGVVSGKVTLEQGIATLQDIRANGSNGEVAVKGEIQLAPDIANSTMQLTVSLMPSAKARASSGFLLNMLPHAPSEGPYHVRGALTSPSVS